MEPAACLLGGSCRDAKAKCQQRAQRQGTLGRLPQHPGHGLPSPSAGSLGWLSSLCAHTCRARGR